MRWMNRWYGAGPLHLLCLVACAVVAYYAAVRLLPSAPLPIAFWLLGAAVGHDLLLLPAYTVVDRAAQRALRGRSAPAATSPRWVNFVRVPAVISGMLLLIWFPLVLRLPAGFADHTGFSVTPYLGRWLWVTGALFAASAAVFLLRVRAGRARRSRLTDR